MNLRQQAHKLNPIIMVGKDGVTENVIEQIRLALKKKRIIKIKCIQSVADKQQAFEDILRGVNCKVVHKIGGVITIADPQYYLANTR